MAYSVLHRGTEGEGGGGEGQGAGELVADHGVAVAAHPSDAAVVARRNAREMMLRKQLRHDRKKKR